MPVAINNARIGLQKRRLRLNNKKGIGLGQSLRDTFSPKLTTRRILKVRRPQTVLRKLKPTDTTLKATTKQDINDEDSSYIVHKPIQVLGAHLAKSEKPPSKAGEMHYQTIDNQLLSPSDPGLDIQGMIRTFLPALLSLGTSVGLALHTLLHDWDTHIQRDMRPEMFWAGDEVIISYGRNMEGVGEDLMPVSINTDGKELNYIIITKSLFSGNMMIGLSDGRQAGFSIQDPQLETIILNLLPEKKKDNTNNLTIKMDKFVFLRIILTYLYQSSVEYII